MKVCVVLAVFFVSGVTSSSLLKCKGESDGPLPTLDWHSKCCLKSMKDQVMNELKASILYMNLGSHFSQDNTNRPGFAKFFYESASEEREHAIKIIKYLLMRGQLIDGVEELINEEYDMPEILNGPIPDTLNVTEALRLALKTEKKVTEHLKDIIKICDQHGHKAADSTPCKDVEDKNREQEFHLVDYLTGEFLEEQYKSQRDIAEKLVNLQKMAHSHGNMGEFLFDKKMLDNEIPVL